MMMTIIRQTIPKSSTPLARKADAVSLSIILCRHGVSNWVIGIGLVADIQQGSCEIAFRGCEITVGPVSHALELLVFAA
jgi:hypothetical protein